MDDTPAYIKAIYDLDGMATPLEDGFEIQFVSGTVDRIARWQDRTWFTPKQKAVIRKMVAKYLGEQRVAEMMGQMRMEGV